MPETFDGWIWWVFSVLIVGLVWGIFINYTSYRLTPRLDNFFGKFSKRGISRNQERKEKIEELAQSMLEDPSEVVINLGHQVFYLNFFAIHVLLGAILVTFLFNLSMVEAKIAALITLFLSSIFIARVWGSFIKCVEIEERYQELKRLKQNSSKSANE